jgi:hypothetical protein
MDEKLAKEICREIGRAKGRKFFGLKIQTERNSWKVAFVADDDSAPWVEFETADGSEAAFRDAILQIFFGDVTEHR